MIREDQVEKILDELEEEFAKANMPVNDKLTLFAKISNAIYKCAEQEPYSDAISRQAAIDVFERFIHELGIKDEPYNYGEMALSPQNVPPVITPTEKVGHWILQPSNKEQGERDFIWWKCSECGQVIYSETEQNRREYHAYCGRCGTRMQGAEE